MSTLTSFADVSDVATHAVANTGRNASSFVQARWIADWSLTEPAHVVPLTVANLAMVANSSVRATLGTCEVWNWECAIFELYSYPLEPVVGHGTSGVCHSFNRVVGDRHRPIHLIERLTVVEALLSESKLHRHPPQGLHVHRTDCECHGEVCAPCII